MERRHGVVLIGEIPITVVSLSLWTFGPHESVAMSACSFI